MELEAKGNYVKEVKMYKGREPLGQGKRFPVVLEAQATRLPCELPQNYRGPIVQPLD